MNEDLVQAAISFVQQRFPVGDWVGAAALRTEDGQILVSTAPDFPNASVEVCHETGAICEAFKLGKKVVATVCVSRDERGKFRILSPCGVCQERLFKWGENVQAAVPLDSDSTQWQIKTLKDLQPYYWKKAISTPGA